MRKQFKSMASWHEAQPEHMKRLMEPQVVNLLKKQSSEQKTSILQQNANGHGQASQAQHQPEVPERCQEEQMRHTSHQQTHHVLKPGTLQLLITRMNNQQQQNQQVVRQAEQEQPYPALQQQVTNNMTHLFTNSLLTYQLHFFRYGGLCH